ncbi:TonB-dependent receptor [Limibacter armeniacum]|uniref:TonB-dependent receptor n=1 Tax=Limibacter armeniacum TaxID=466084 RepID=UPI002FE60E38
MKYIIKLMIACLMFPAFVFGQTVEGTVSEINEQGNKLPLAGANVYWLNTTTGTTTKPDGKFLLAIPKGKSQLVISYVGFLSDTVSVASNTSVDITLHADDQLSEVEVVGDRGSSYMDFVETVGVQNMTEKELFKAACCNLSESFETNPSVDVSFTDAITGTRQIEMLGLAGRYAQITTESLPTIRGLSSNFGLTYLPGTWLQSIQVSKGVGSVVNGYESITGQINAELKKPFISEKLMVNAYANQGGRLELNVNTMQKISEKWSTATLLHASGRTTKQDHNDDGFLDFPLASQFNGIHRWKYESGKGLEAQVGIKYLQDRKQGGQVDFDPEVHKFGTEYYGLEINTDHAEVFAKTGYVFPEKPYRSIGFQLTGTYHDQDAYFGNTVYQGQQKSVYTNLIYQSIISTTDHKFKTGLTFLYDDYDETFGSTTFEETNFRRTEAVFGAYAEYSMNLQDKFQLIAGLRGDYHNMFGAFVTPRLHARYALTERTAVRATAGRGQRTANIFAENMAVFASAREVNILADNIQEKAYGLNPEVAWNYGLGLQHEFELFYKDGSLNVDFYHTNFQNQIVVDLDHNTQEILFYNLNGTSYSNSLQAELTYSPLRRFDVKLAYRWLDVKTDYSETRLQKPLTAQHRAFSNFSYETREGEKGGKWLFDYTVQWNGQKRLPNTQSNPEEFRMDNYSPNFFLMNAQVTKSLKNQWLEVYLGMENIGNVTQEYPIISAENPFDPHFDSSIVWGPIFGRMTYAGLRFKL